MRRIVHDDLAPRLEMTPMIDVVFLLLTFFIYSLAMMIQTQVLPVRLTTVTAGGQASASSQGEIQAITIDKNGAFFFNREAVSPDQLNKKLAEFAANPQRPPLYLAMEAHGATDRGPVLLDLINRVRQAGIENFVIVGQKTGGGATPDSTSKTGGMER